jgi:hypothetical protein
MGAAHETAIALGSITKSLPILPKHWRRSEPDHFANRYRQLCHELGATGLEPAPLVPQTSTNLVPANRVQK